MTNYEAMVDANAELPQTEGLNYPVEVELSDLLHTEQENARNRAINVFLQQDLNTRHQIKVSGGLVDYAIGYDPALHSDEVAFLGHDPETTQARLVELENRIATFDNTADSDFQRKLNQNKREAANLRTQLADRIKLGMMVLELPKPKLLSGERLDTSDIGTPLHTRIVQTKYDDGPQISRQSTLAQTAHALAGVVVAVNPTTTAHAGEVVKDFTIQQPDSIEHQLLASLAVSDMSHVEHDDKGMYQTVDVNGHPYKVYLDETQVEYLGTLRDRLAAQQPAETPKMEPVYLPGVLANGQFAEAHADPDKTPTVPVPSGTPTPIEPTPTSIPSPTEKPIEQGPVDIKPDVKVGLADAAQPYWSESDVLDKDGNIEGNVVGYFPGSDGKPEQYVVDINGQRGQIPPEALVDPSQVVKVEPIRDGDFSGMEHVVVDEEHPLTLRKGMPGAYDDMFEISQDRLDQVIKLRFKAEIPEGEPEPSPYELDASIYVHCGEASTGGTTAAIAYRSDENSILSVTTNPPYRTGDLILKGTIGANINNRMIELQISEDRGKIRIVDTASGVPLPFRPQTPGTTKKDSIIRVPGPNGLIDVFDKTEEKLASIKQLGDGWIDLGGEKFTKSDDWIANYISPLVPSESSMRVSHLSAHIKTGPEGQHDQNFKRELEKANGLAQFSTKESMPVGVIMSMSSTPYFRHVLTENAARADLTRDMFGLTSAMGEKGQKLHLTTVQVAVVEWLRRNQIPFDISMSAAWAPPGRDTRQDLNAYIEVLASIQPGAPLTIGSDLFDPKTGAISKDIAWLKAYNGNGLAYATDVVTNMNAEGAPVRFTIPKADKTMVDKMINVVRGINTQHNVEGVNIDIGKLSPQDATNTILSLKAQELKVYIDQVADNTDGLTVEQIIEIAELTGADGRIIGTPEKRDPTKRYAIEDGGGDSDYRIYYTDVYYHYRDKLGQILVDRGHFAVYSAITENTYYFANMRQAAESDPTDQRWEIFRKSNQQKGIDVDSILQQALLYAK